MVIKGHHSTRGALQEVDDDLGAWGPVLDWESIAWRFQEKENIP
ncbi:hypothetical protein N825_30375 [Skermanella stibiiresistens SB22]|uniref:Uncharacterized protein n=1 Tax=Skermanella stibiiresistens SB22 TaxID=1385369 RepID=W9H913_9PROT|nr:hypothetical protein N825_30375 [Skermanella stibiiresistens SB22]